MFQLPFFLERSLRHSSSSFRLFSTSSFNEDTVVSLPFTTSTKFLGDKINCLPHEIKSTSKIFYCSKRILREPLENTQVCSIPSVQVFAAQWGQGIELLL